MNICDTIKLGREENRAIRQSSWPPELFVYHGMDNQLRFSDSHHPLSFAVATFLANDWELAKAPYHGSLASPTFVTPADWTDRKLEAGRKLRKVRIREE